MTTGNEPSLSGSVYLMQVDIDSLTLEECNKLMTTEQKRLVVADCVETVFCFPDVSLDIVEKALKVAWALRKFARDEMSYEDYHAIERDADLKWPHKYMHDLYAREDFMVYQLSRARYYLRKKHDDLY